MLEQTENATTIIGLSIFPGTLAKDATGLILFASAGVLCLFFFLFLCKSNDSRRIAPAQPTHEIEVVDQPGMVSREVLFGRYSELQ